VVATSAFLSSRGMYLSGRVLGRTPGRPELASRPETAMIVKSELLYIEFIALICSRLSFSSS
jgi:hypothetical protein